MARPFTDIAKSISANPIKNGTLVTSTTFTGEYSLNNNCVKNTPIISDIASKYGNRFYNGIFVELVGTQTVVGG
jgi:hypothetical protein